MASCSLANGLRDGFLSIRPSSNSTEKICNCIYIENAGDNVHNGRYLAETGDKTGNIIAIMCECKNLGNIYVALTMHDNIDGGD